MAIKFLSSGNVTGGLTLSGALSGTSATFTGDITARIGNFKSPDASESIIMNLAANNGNNAATFRTTASGSIFEIRSQNSGTIKIDSPTTTFTGNVIIDGTATIGGSDVITRSGTTAQGRLAIWQNDSAIKGDNNLFYASQYLTVGVGTTGGFAALRINAATTAETYLDFTEGATFTKRAQIQVDTNDNMYFRNTSNNTLALTIDSSQNVQVDGSNVTVINASDPNITVSDDDTNYRGSMRWLTSSNVLEFFTRYAGTYYTNNLVLDRGNVGIGTSAPSVNFEIAKSGARIKMIDGTNQLNMGLWDSVNYRFEGDANRPMFFTSYQGNINFGISGSTTMTIQDNVGIGTTSPDFKLDIEAIDSGVQLQLGRTNTSAGSTWMGSDSNGFHLGVGAYGAGNSVADPNGFTVDTSGNVGIGTATPQKKVHIEGTGGASEMQILVSSASDTVGHTAGIGLRGEGGEADGDFRIKGGIFFERIAGSFGNGKMILAVNSSVSNTSVTVADHALTIDTNKSVGIGTTSPTTPLNVAGNLLVSTTVVDGQEDRFKVVGGGAADAGNVYVYNDTQSATIRLNSGGASYFTNGLMVGYTSGSYKVQVLEESTNTTNIGVYTNIRGAGTNNYAFYADAANGTSTNFGFYGNSGKNAFLGDTGIGTDSPQGKLDSVAPAADLTDFGRATGSALNIRIANVTNRLGQINFCNDAAPAFGYGSIGMVMTSGSGVGLGDMVFGTKGSGSAVVSTERMRIDSNGSIGMGANSSAYRLRIKTDATVTNGVYISAGTGNSNHSLYVEDKDGTAEYFAVRGDGQIRLNTSRVGDTLFGCTALPSASVFGSAFKSDSKSRYTLMQSCNSTALSDLQEFFNPNGAVGKIQTSGSATLFTTSSDYRLKEDLQDFNGLDKVSKISVYDFKWKTDKSRSYGVMAHELQEVLPNAVGGKKDAEEMQGVDYSKIVPLLVKSIQELKAEIEILKKK